MDGLRHADRHRRFAAVLFDFAALLVVCALLSAAHVAVRDGLGGTLAADRLGRGLATTALAAVVVWQTCMLARTGQTAGKLLAGVRVVRAADGGRAGFLAACVVRLVAHGFLCLIPVYVVVDTVLALRGDGRTLHDRLAGTIVVDAAPARSVPAAGAARLRPAAVDLILRA